MKTVITGDIHLTASPADEYRWDVFPKLRTLAKERLASAIFILGDLTDKKDRHPASLVNRACAQLQMLAEVAEVHILKGNHDYIDPSCPFFHFTNSIDGVRFHSEPYLDPEEQFLLLPHTRTPDRDWVMQDTNYPLVCLHQTVKGAVASNGAKLDGEMRADWFGGVNGVVVSGDIHVPQKVGALHYVGAPHPVRFGDDFVPRFLSTNKGRWRSHSIETIRKVTAEIVAPDDLYLMELDPYDQVKLTLVLSPSEVGFWDELRAGVMEAAEDLGVLVSSITPVVPRKSVRERMASAPGTLSNEKLLNYLHEQDVNVEVAETLLLEAESEIQQADR